MSSLCQTGVRGSFLACLRDVFDARCVFARTRALWRRARARARVLRGGKRCESRRVRGNREEEESGELYFAVISQPTLRKIPCATPGTRSSSVTKYVRGRLLPLSWPPFKSRDPAARLSPYTLSSLSFYSLSFSRSPVAAVTILV